MKRLSGRTTQRERHISCNWQLVEQRRRVINSNVNPWLPLCFWCCRWHTFSVDTFLPDLLPKDLTSNQRFVADNLGCSFCQFGCVLGYHYSSTHFQAKCGCNSSDSLQTPVIVLLCSLHCVAWCLVVWLKTRRTCLLDLRLSEIPEKNIWGLKTLPMAVRKALKQDVGKVWINLAIVLPNMTVKYGKFKCHNCG